MRKYGSVDNKTLLLCFKAWQELKYDSEYRAKETASFDAGLSGWYMALACDVALDLQDLQEELMHRRISVFFDSITEEYSTDVKRSK